MIPFGIVFLSFAVAWERGTSQVGAPSFFPLVGWLFIVIGAYVVIGRPVRVRYVRTHTRYVITDRRAIALMPRATVDCPLSNQPVTVRRSGSGRATAHIGTPVPRYYTSVSSGISTRTIRYMTPVRLEHVADADTMEAALNLARSRPPGPTGVQDWVPN